MMGEAPKSKALFYYFKLGDYTKAAFVTRLRPAPLIIYQINRQLSEW